MGRAKVPADAIGKWRCRGEVLMDIVTIGVTGPLVAPCSRRNAMNEECHVDAVHKSPSFEEQREQIVTMLAVEGMGCQNCVKRVRNGLLQVYGVVSADVDLAAARARVVYNPRLVQPKHLQHAVADAGAAVRHEYRATIIA